MDENEVTANLPQGTDWNERRAFFMALGFDTRCAHALARTECLSLRDVAGMTEAEFLRLPDIGRTSLRNGSNALARWGLAFRGGKLFAQYPKPLSQATAATPAEEFCHGCRFWNRDDPEVFSGDCRRHAPRLSGMAAPHGNSIHQDPRAAMWPMTMRDDWCGEFVADEPPCGV